MELPTNLLITRGCILHSTIFEYINHGKFFVIIGEDENSFVGLFFINSGINAFNHKNHLLQMQFLLTPSDYTFLSHNSYLSCTALTKIDKQKLANSINTGQTEYKGQLLSTHLNKIMILVRESKLFSRKEKETYFK